MAITIDQITRFNECVKRFEMLKPKEQLGMRNTLNDVEISFLASLVATVHLGTVLDYIAASTYEAADSCDGEGRDWLIQQASVVSAAALFCKTWEPGK